MIFIKNSEQIKQMKEAGRITGEAIAIAGEMVREGVTTKQLDTKIRNHIEKCGARPSFLGYGGFPGSACISVNSQVIHGIPSDKVVLKEGDIVKIDVGAFIGGFHGDSANTFPVGRISEEAAKLIEVTKKSFERGGRRLRYRIRLFDGQEVRRSRRGSRPSRGSECSELRTRRTRSEDLPRYGHRNRTDDQHRNSRCP